MAPAVEPVVDRGRRAIVARAILPPAPHPQHMDDRNRSIATARGWSLTRAMTSGSATKSLRKSCQSLVDRWAPASMFLISQMPSSVRAVMGSSAFGRQLFHSSPEFTWATGEFVVKSIFAQTRLQPNAKMGFSRKAIYFFIRAMRPSN